VSFACDENTDKIIKNYLASKGIKDTDIIAIYVKDHDVNPSMAGVLVASSRTTSSGWNAVS
jgi:hypothetical protein